MTPQSQQLRVNKQRVKLVVHVGIAGRERGSHCALIAAVLQPVSLSMYIPDMPNFTSCRKMSRMVSIMQQKMRR